MRRLSLPRSLAVWAVVALLVWLDQAHPLGVPVTAAFSFGWLIVGIVGAFKEIGKAAVTTAVLIAKVAVMIGVALARVGIPLAVIFAKVYGLLARFWAGALRPLLAFLGRTFDRFVGWLTRTMGPILKFLEAVRKAVDRIYQKYLKPILDTIEIVRRVSQLLAALHVPFAKELDAKLAQLEERLLAPIRAVYAKLNEAMNWINRIITLDGLLQRITLLRSIRRDVLEISRAFRAWRHSPVSAAKYSELRRAAGERTTDDVKRDVRDVLTTGGGNYGTFVSEMAAQWGIYVRAR